MRNLEDAEKVLLDAPIAEVILAGVRLTPNTYTVDTTQQVAIWFSNNRNVAMPTLQKDRLALRARNNPNGTTKLVYDSSLLATAAREDLEKYAQENNIMLIDFQDILSENPLLKLAREEIDKIKNDQGGNPASASDLVRWVPEIMGDTCIYADIDLEVNEVILTGKKTSGLPVLLHMGSIIEKGYQRAPYEACVINTDIIGFTESSLGKEAFFNKVSEEIIDSYNHPFKTLEKTQSFIVKTDAYKNFKGDLFDLRKATKNCTQDLETFCTFLGPELLKKQFSLQNDDVKVIQEIINGGNQNKDELITQILSKNLVDKTLAKHINDIQEMLYKPLVIEFSGPGAVHRAIGPEALTVKYRNTSEPTIVPRALELLGCVNGIAPFKSDNIPAWKTPQETFENTSYNKDGLSWAPKAQNELATPIEKETFAIEFERDTSHPSILVDDSQQVDTWQAATSRISPAWAAKGVHNQQNDSVDQPVLLWDVRKSL